MNKLSSESVRLRNFAAVATAEDAKALFEGTAAEIAKDPVRAAVLLEEAMAAYAVLVMEYTDATGKAPASMYLLPDDLKHLYGLACVVLAKLTGKPLDFRTVDKTLRASTVEEVK